MNSCASFRFLLPGILLLAGLLLLPTDGGAAEPPRLFNGTLEAEGPWFDLPPDLVERSRLAMGGLEELGGLDRIRLNLFDDLEVTARRTRFHSREPGHGVWVGEVEGGILDTVILVRKDGWLAGSIRLGDRYFRIEPLEPGLQRIEEVHTGALGECGGAVEPPPEALSSEAETTPGRPGGGPAAETLADDGSTIDVLVVYTPEMRASRGGIETIIETTIEEANAAYANSDVYQRLRLVHTEEIQYTESGNGGTDLNRLRGTSDGYMDDVHALRNAWCADIVHLWVSNASGICGIAYLMRPASSGFQGQAFGVVRGSPGCEPGGLVQGHELGHNMGCAHDVDNAGSPGAYSYSYGWQDPNRAFRTVMAYNNGCNCPRIDNFSNPNVEVNNTPTGAPSANNAETLNGTANIVANFRDSTACLDNFCSEEVWNANDTSCFSADPLTESQRDYSFCEDDKDYVKVGLQAGESYVIETSQLGPDADTEIKLRATGCISVLDRDDNGGGGFASRLEYTPTEDGCYGLEILQVDGTFGPGRDYHLSVQGNLDASLCCQELQEPRTLTLERDGTLSWGGSELSSFNVYRGDQQQSFLGYNHICFDAAVQGTTSADPERPNVDGRFFYYLVSGTADCGETNLGVDSEGTQRPNADACP